MDEETRRIIYQSLLNKKDDSINAFCRPDNVPIKKKKVKERKPKNVGLSLLDFEKKLEDKKSRAKTLISNNANSNLCHPRRRSSSQR